MPSNKQQQHKGKDPREVRVMRKRVMSKGPNEKQWIELAEFRMEDGKLTSDWKDPDYKREIMRIGIIAWDKVVFPSDGRAFFDALDNEYRLSSTMDVLID